MDGITEGPGYVRVDFGSANVLQVSETYRSFANLCIGKQVSGALLKAGDEDLAGHARLRDALSAMARAAAIPANFKLALVPGTAPIEAFFRESQQALRAAGLNAWVFDTVHEAVEWLEGRSASGVAAS